jgi:hypothetical protein
MEKVVVQERWKFKIFIVRKGKLVIGRRDVSRCMEKGGIILNDE